MLTQGENHNSIRKILTVHFKTKTGSSKTFMLSTGSEKEPVRLRRRRVKIQQTHASQRQKSGQEALTIVFFFLLIHKKKIIV